MILDGMALGDDTSLVALEDYYSVAEAARILKVSTDAIYTAIKKSKLVAKRQGGVMFIHKDELERYRKEKKKPGRPREKRQYTRKTDT